MRGWGRTKWDVGVSLKGGRIGRDGGLNDRGFVSLLIRKARGRGKWGAL